MSFSGGLPRFYPANFKMRKGKEHLQRSNCQGKWKALMVILWVLGVTLVGICCFFYGFSVGFYKAQFGCSSMEVKKDSFLFERFNGSQDQLLSLPDQVLLLFSI